jgi:hypothetical protein
MRTYLFPSSRDPKTTYKTTVHDNGAVTCDCPARVECWHKKRVKAYPPIGRSPDVPISRDDQRSLMRLLSEGNDGGARRLALSLFPSMSIEETDDLLQEVFDANLENHYEELSHSPSDTDREAE